MKKNTISQTSDTVIADEIRSTKAYMENLLGGIMDCAVKMAAEEERTDNLQKARMLRYCRRFEMLVHEYAQCLMTLDKLRKA